MDEVVTYSFHLADCQVLVSLYIIHVLGKRERKLQRVSLTYSK